jgi:hypothetical protein
MAKKTIFVDDVDGSEGGVATHRFSLDGDSYEIDLSSQNATALLNMLAPYIKAARQTGRSKKRRPGREQQREVREWARAHGYEVADRGALPQDVLDAYRAGVNGR